MISFENISVCNFPAAIRGMRNPMESWGLSDSGFDENNNYVIGEKDLKLARNLSIFGDDESKFLRMIIVSMDIIAPLYYWKEADQYKVGTTTNSCSTMHKIHSRDLTLDDFSYDHLFMEYSDDTADEIICSDYAEDILKSVDSIYITLDMLNGYREKFIKTKDKKYWWQLIQLLPSSYNQRRTWCGNYAVLKNMYHARKNHKLDEWHDFCKMCETLPYFKEICIDI